MKTQRRRALGLLQAKHAPHDTVVSKCMINRAAHVYRYKRKQSPACPEMDVGIEDVQLFVLITPVRQL